MSSKHSNLEINDLTPRRSNGNSVRPTLGGRKERGTNEQSDGKRGKRRVRRITEPLYRLFGGRP